MKNKVRLNLAGFLISVAITMQSVVSIAPSIHIGIKKTVIENCDQCRIGTAEAGQAP